MFLLKSSYVLFYLRNLSECKIVRDRLAASEPGQSFYRLVDG
jgi:hypothetical protein